MKWSLIRRITGWTRIPADLGLDKVAQQAQNLSPPIFLISA